MHVVTRAFSLDKNQYLAAIYWRGMGKAIALLVALVVVVDFLLVPRHALVPTLAGSLVAVILWAVFARYATLKWTFGRPKNGRMFAPRTLEFDDQEVRARASTGAQSSMPWSDVVSVERRGALTLLFVSGIVHIPVPDDAFERFEDREAFFALVREHAAGGARALAKTKLVQTG